MIGHSIDCYCARGPLRLVLKIDTLGKRFSQSPSIWDIKSRFSSTDATNGFGVKIEEWKITVVEGSLKFDTFGYFVPFGFIFFYEVFFFSKPLAFGVLWRLSLLDRLPSNETLYYGDCLLFENLKDESLLTRTLTSTLFDLTRYSLQK